MTQTPTNPELEAKILEIVKLFKLTKTYGVNPQLPVNDIMKLIEKEALKARINQTQVIIEAQTHNALGVLGIEEAKVIKAALTAQLEQLGSK